MSALVRVLLALLLLAAGPLRAAPDRWTTVWATAQLEVDTHERPDAAALEGGALRQTVLLTGGASRLRVRLSNRHGTAPLEIRAAHVARAPGAGAATILPGTDHPLRFNGASGVTIPAGADYLSDPVALDVPPLSHLAITLRVAGPVAGQTGHPGARTVSHLAAEAWPSAPSLPGATPLPRWFHIAAVDAEGPASATIAILGDSITDGYGVVPDSDGRWPDHLARRLQADPATRHFAVANLGIGGNRLLRDGLGPNAMARLESDVLALSGLRHLILLIGVNDLGTLTREAPAPPDAHKALVADMLAAYAQIVERARARGIQVIGGTILPYGASAYYHPGAADEANRQAVNAWLRTPGSVDALIDFDAALRDPADPRRLRADTDSGDGLHPSAAGYRAMADAVPIGLFAPAPAVVLTFDDLPEHGPLPAGVNASQVARSITATLRRHRVPVAYGFANMAQVERNLALAEALRIWTEAGYPLANHGWSHVALDTLTPAGFDFELMRNEAALGSALRYFRYPFLAEGKDPALRDAARRILADRGYSIAPVSIDFSDWALNTAYARCAAQKNSAGIARLEAAFLADAEAAIHHARKSAMSQFGRDIPQVLLLHAGGMTARMLPHLLAMIEEQGFRYGSLAEALADPVHAASRHAALPFETSTLSARPGYPRSPTPTKVSEQCASSISE
jgi:lysophospholipase L1-like esterase